MTLRLFDLYPSAGLWELAHREGLWMSHEMGSHIEDVADVLAGLDAKGLLTSDHAFNHCNALPEETWALIKRSGAAVNLAPRSDAAFGVGTGFPPIDQARGGARAEAIRRQRGQLRAEHVHRDADASTAAASSAASRPAARTRQPSWPPPTCCGTRPSAAPPTRACPARSAPSPPASRPTSP